MQRMNIAVFIVIVSSILLYPTTLLSAASTSPTPTPTTASVKIRNSVVNERIETTQDAQPGPNPTPIYSASVPPVSVNPSTDNFKIPKLNEISDWLTRTTLYMGAKQINDNVIPHGNNLYISGQARRCITYAGIKLPDQIGNAYKTEPVSYLPKLITATELLSSQTVRNTISLINGSYDFQGPSYEVDEAPPCTTAGGVGTPQEPKQITLVQGFNLAQWAKSLLERFIVKTVFISKQLTPEADRIHCLLTGCVKGGADLAYMKDSDKQEKIKKSGGVADAFRTVDMDTTKGKSPHGQEENFTKTNTFATKQMENSADLIKCSLVPKALRGALGLTEEKCNGFVKDLQTPTSCGLPSVSADTACKLCNSDAFATDADILTSFEMSTLPNGLPQKAIQVLEAAAQTYQVPAAMLLAIMLNEGSFEHPGVWDWTDENVEKWSQCGAEMLKCEDFAHPVTNAKGPFGFLKSDWAAVKKAVLKYDPNRPKDKLSPCNFVDAAFASAKEIHDDQSHLYVDQTRYGMPPDSCLGTQIYKGRDIPATCSVWTPERVALTEWQYGERICNRTISSAVSIFKRYSCR